MVAGQFGYQANAVGHVAMDLGGILVNAIILDHLMVEKIVSGLIDYWITVTKDAVQVLYLHNYYI